MKEKEKKVWLLTGILFLLIMVVGISYALWQKVFVQENENVIISDCFEVSFESEEESAIYFK